MTEKEGKKERERECTEGGVGEAERKAHKCIIVSDRMQGEDVSSGSVITFLSQTISSIQPTEAASSLFIPISNYFNQIKSPIDKLLRSLSLYLALNENTNKQKQIIIGQMNLPSPSRSHRRATSMKFVVTRNRLMRFRS